MDPSVVGNPVTTRQRDLTRWSQGMESASSMKMCSSKGFVKHEALPAEGEGLCKSRVRYQIVSSWLSNLFFFLPFFAILLKICYNEAFLTCFFKKWGICGYTACPSVSLLFFSQAHFEPVEQFQPIWQKTKGLRHRNFGIFHQKLKVKEEKKPVCCCECGWQGGWHSTQRLGVDREAADPRGRYSWAALVQIHWKLSFLSRALHQPTLYYYRGVCRF